MENSEEIKRLTFSYTLDDLHTRLLFVASEKKHFKISRHRDLAILAAILLIFIVYNFMKGNTEEFRTLSGILIFWLIVGPWFLKKYHKAHYKDVVKKNESQFLDKEIIAQLDEQKINFQEGEITSNIPWSEIELVIEIDHYLFFKIRNEQFIMLPKSDQNPHLPDWISELAEKNKVPYVRNFGWKW